MTKILGYFFFSTLSSQEIIPPLEGPSKKEEEEGSLFLSRSLFFPFIFFLFLRKWVISLVGPRSLHPPLALWSEHIKEGWGEGGKEIVVHSVATGPRAEYGPIKMAGASVRPTKKSPWALGAQSVVLPTTAIFVFRIKAYVPRRYVRSVHCSRCKKN